MMNKPAQIKKITGLLEELELCFQRRAKIEQLAAAALEDDFDIDIEVRGWNKEQEIKENEPTRIALENEAPVFGFFEMMKKRLEQEIKENEPKVEYHEVLPDTTALQVLGILLNNLDAKINKLSLELESLGVNIQLQ